MFAVGLFADVTIDQKSTVSNNSASLAAGGGVAVECSGASLYVSNATISGNVAGTVGGGIALSTFTAGGTTTIANSTVSGNRAGQFGGGLSLSGKTIRGGSSGTVTMTGCTVNNNTANTLDGGGMFLRLSNTQNSALVNDTISNNNANAGSGGGINVATGDINIVNATIASNQIIGGTGGGIHNSGGNVSIGNSIIALNAKRTSAASAPVYDDAAGTFHFFTTGPFAVTGGGPNLVTSLASVSGSNFTSDPILFTGNPQLGPLANNGGPTQTRAITNASPAALRGSYALDVAFQVFGALNDQRGIRRVPPNPPFMPDIGAFD
jgi:hypothetical protein